jgi:hypothetical protein
MRATRKSLRSCQTSFRFSATPFQTPRTLKCPDRITD